MHHQNQEHMRSAFFVLATALSYIGSACCGHIQADIRYASVVGNTYRVEVIVYTCLSAPNEHPEIQVSIDQGVAIVVPRTSITDDPAQDIRRSEYSFEHDFAENGMHTVNATVGMRGGGVLNIPNSISEPLCVQADLLVGPMAIANSSIRFSTPPTEVVQNWNTFIHTPAPFDADGDSVAFEWISPSGAFCTPINGYAFPNGINIAYLDPVYGTFTWDYPPYNGETNLTIRGSEYRDGQLIGRVTRDMIICVFGFVAGLDVGGTIQQLHLSPSITNDIVRVDNPTALPLPMSIRDARGRLLVTLTLRAGRSSIDLSPLPSGAYFISATTVAGLRFSGRVMKQ